MRLTISELASDANLHLISLRFQVFTFDRAIPFFNAFIRDKL